MPFYFFNIPIKRIVCFTSNQFMLQINDMSMLIIVAMHTVRLTVIFHIQWNSENTIIKIGLGRKTCNYSTLKWNIVLEIMKYQTKQSKPWWRGRRKVNRAQWKSMITSDGKMDVFYNNCKMYIDKKWATW